MTTHPSSPLNATLAAVTARIEQRSTAPRQAYLDVLARAKKPGPYRGGHGLCQCGARVCRHADQ